VLKEHQVKDLHNFLVGNGVVVHNGYSFPKDRKRLAQILGKSLDEVHDFVKDAIREYKSKFPYWVGKNPDVGPGPTGKLEFKVRKPGRSKSKIWEADISWTDYLNSLP